MVKHCQISQRHSSSLDDTQPQTHLHGRDPFLDVRCIMVAYVVTLRCGHVTKRVALCGHIVVDHMCQTKSPSPVRQYVCIMSKYYRVCICSMVFELAAS